jgi:hypothetical protein
LVAGSIGEGLAVKFMAHRKIASQLPNPSDILSGKVKDLKCKEVSAMYSLITSMCYELQDSHDKFSNDKKKMEEWYLMAENFLQYSMDNFNTEIVVMGARTALSVYKLPFFPGKLKNFNDFHKSYGKYILSSSAV